MDFKDLDRHLEEKLSLSDNGEYTQGSPQMFPPPPHPHDAGEGAMLLLLKSTSGRDAAEHPPAVALTRRWVQVSDFSEDRH